MERESLIASIDDLLETLTGREKEVIIMHYGLGGQKEHTLQEIGEKFHVSRERIRQIEARSRQKLHRIALRKKLADFLN
jgi:RNA polymerase primary sigma factor